MQFEHLRTQLWTNEPTADRCHQASRYFHSKAPPFGVVWVWKRKAVVIHQNDDISLSVCLLRDEDVAILAILKRVFDRIRGKLIHDQRNRRDLRWGQCNGVLFNL